MRDPFSKNTGEPDIIYKGFTIRLKEIFPNYFSYQVIDPLQEGKEILYTGYGLRRGDTISLAKKKADKLIKP